MMGREEKKHLKMLARKDQIHHAKIQKLKKKYQYATGGSGRRFLLGFALRQLRAHGKRAGSEKKSWAITTISSQEGEVDDFFESEESVENEEGFFNFENVEDTTSGPIPLSAEVSSAFNFKSQEQQFQSDRGKEALPSTLCPLQRTQEFEMGLHLLTEIEEHIITNNSICHHASLQELFFRGSSDIDGTTPLLLACHYGKLDCVKHIIENWGVHVDSAAVYYLDKNDRILGATPLFVAAFNRHLSIAQYLVGKGANLDLKTYVQNNNPRHEFSGLTPLQGAVLWPPFEAHPKSDKEMCTMNKDISNMVLFLLEAGADPSPLPSNGTPIWNLICDVQATIALIDHGIDLDQQNSDGETILLGWAAYNSHHLDDGDEKAGLTIVKKLIDKGADITARDNKGFTVIFKAITASNWTVVNFLLGRREIGRMEKIEAMEVAAAIILSGNSPDDTELERAVGYWRHALRLRQLEPSTNPKTPITLKSGRAAEWTTTEQLEHLASTPIEFRLLQSFYIRLRIFSTWSWEAVYTLRSSFLACIHYLEKEKRDVDRLDVLWAALEVIHRFVALQKENLCSITDDVVGHLINLMLKLEKINPRLFRSVNLVKPLEVMVATDPFCSRTSHFLDAHMRTLLMLFDFLASRTEILNEDIMKLLRQLVNQDSHNTRGRSLLQKEFTHLSLRLPIVKLLLQSGANPNAGDVDGNGPLHLLSSNFGNVEVVAGAARLLLDYGAHLDRVNKKKETAAQVWIRQNGIEGGVPGALPEWLREPETRVSKLKCLSAMVISSENIQYDESTLPATLHLFINKH